MSWIPLGELVPIIEENTQFFTFQKCCEVCFFKIIFHNELYGSQQERDLPKAVTWGEFVLLSIHSVLAVDSTLSDSIFVCKR